MDPLQLFSEPTREWFRASFGTPTAAQAGAWSSVAEGKNALVVAPTGSGKTLSAFLWSIDQLFTEVQAGEVPSQDPAVSQERAGSARSADKDPASSTSVLYISPLKALGVDIERNLRSPLVGISHTARRLGGTPPEITVGVRTGDTSPKQRRDLVRNPPDVLITTPESLYLMLTSQARETLAGVRTVIIDEVHALAGTKRGAHLAVSLERLDSLLELPAQRIGLSATVEPHEEVARFLGGSRPVDVVAPQSQKEWDITVSVPVEDMSAPASPIAPENEGPSGAEPAPATGEQVSIWPHVEQRIVELVSQRRSTIVFVNSRRLAEKLTGRINELAGSTQESSVSDPGNGDDPDSPPLARSHHGSVSKEQRKVIEEQLKSGQLKCVVATSSLELGIDMGAVDLVIQVESPHAVSAGLQRIGRAGHQVGEVSVGWFFPKHRGDLISTAAVVERMLEGRIEALHIPQNPLDILAQQTVAASAMDALDVEEWFETLRRSAPFASLPRSAYEATLDLLAGKYPSDRFADLRPRIVWDRDAGTLTGRPGSQRLAVTSGGTIPDRGLFGVYLVGGDDSAADAVAGSARTGGRRVGELDEEMVYESRVGDVFALGATSWRIEEITFDRVLVSPAFGQPAAMPFWRGDGIGRPAELGKALGRFQRELHTSAPATAHQRLSDLGLDEWARQNLLKYLEDQHHEVGALPSDTTLVVEQTRDELGDWRIILHSPYGLQVHAPWALAVGERLYERYGLDGSALASDDGIVLRVPMMDEEPPGQELFRFEPEELEEIVTERVSSSALFAGRFREAAARALLLPRQNPGQRTPLWQQRQRSSQLLEIAAGYPDFPLIVETMREVLQDVYDMPALMDLARGIGQRKIRITEATTAKPSPFAQSILFGYIAQYLYEGDSPLAERRAAALSVDPELLGQLLGRVELSEFLDTEVIAEAEAHAQRLSPSRRLTGEEGAADLLRLLGPLSIRELAQRLSPQERYPGVASEADPSLETEEGSLEEAPAAHLDPEMAHSYATSLVEAHRAFAVTWNGQTRYAAVEDASRLRDGLGVPLPQGLPQAFLEPVDDPLGDLVGRYARTHGPFTAEDVSTELGLGRAVTVEVLHRLQTEGRVVEGRFLPDGQDQPEFCDSEMLRRIRRRSLAALRAQVEPVPARAYAEFLAEWQSTAPGTQVEGLGGLAEVIAQLSGLPAPASAWESFLFPSRIKDYRPALLDELLASGEAVVTGHGALSGHDGWIAFQPRQDADAIFPPDPEFTPSDLQRAILNILEQGGAWFAEALHQRLAEDSARHSDGDITGAAALPQVQEALWELFWSGKVVPDTFTVVRTFLNSGTTAHRRRQQPLRSRHTSRRMALRRAVEAHRDQREAHSSGRWALAPEGQEAATTAAHTRAEILLDRYGVVTRGSVMAEQLPGGFAGVYKILTAAEEAGQIRRGYFIEKLGASQFTSSSTVDQLRAVAEALEERAARAPEHRTDDFLVLAATDPANPYGAALDWPSPPAKARPGRKAGAVVVLHHGELVLYMERGGRTVLLFTEDETVMDPMASALTERLRAANTGRIAVKEVNSESILQTRFAQSLRAAGFHSSPSGLRFAP